MSEQITGERMVSYFKEEDINKEMVAKLLDGLFKSTEETNKEKEKNKKLRRKIRILEHSVNDLIRKREELESFWNKANSQ